MLYSVQEEDLFEAADSDEEMMGTDIDDADETDGSVTSDLLSETSEIWSDNASVTDGF